MVLKMINPIYVPKHVTDGVAEEDFVLAMLVAGVHIECDVGCVGDEKEFLRQEIRSVVTAVSLVADV